MNRNHVFNKYIRRSGKLQRCLKFAHLGVETKSISELYLYKRMNMFQSILQASKTKNKKKKNSENRLSSSEQILLLRQEVNRTRKIQDDDDDDVNDDDVNNVNQIGEEVIEDSDSSSYKTIKIWVDGACSNNGRPNAKAGYGVYFAGGGSDNENISERLLGEKQTNQRAELMACISALERVTSTEKPTQNIAVKIYSDSKYVIDGITLWIHKWVKLNWKDTIANLDLWKWLYDLVYNKRPNLRIDWIHVRGHQGIHGNEQADSLARAGACLPDSGTKE